MRWGTDVETETPIDWVWGTGFEGRSVRPIGRTAPGTGGGGAVTGTPPSAVISGVSAPATGTNYSPGEPIDVTVNSTDSDGLVISQLVETVGENDSQSVGAGSQVVRLFAPGSHTSVTTYQIRLTATDDDGNSHKAFQAVIVDAPAAWTSHAFSSAVDTPGLLNAFTIKLQPSLDIPAGDIIKITGITGMNQAGGNLTFTDSLGRFTSASAVSWDSATSTVTLTPDLDVPAASVTTVSFEITNGTVIQTAITPTLSAIGMESVTLDPAGAIVSPLTSSPSGLANAISQGLVTVITNTALLALTPPAQVAGQVQMYYTQADMRFHFYDHSANVWRYFQYQT